MEKNKYICPQCGSEMNYCYEKPALNLSCPKCGCKIATTKWDDIDLDDSIYEIVLEKDEYPTIEIIKLISRLTGKNYIDSKASIMNGSISFKGSAIEIKAKKEVLEKNNIKYHFLNDFPY